MKLRFVSVLILLVVLLAACTGPTAPVVNTPVAQTPTSGQQAAPEASLAAQQALVEQLGVNPDAIQLDRIEDAEWPNACLGLARPDEACAEVITPGYLFTFTVNGNTYEVRTNLDGTLVRVGTPAGQVVDGESPMAVEKAREALAGQLGIALDQVRLVSVEPMDWPDGCLGLGQPNESCLMAIVPGFRVTLEANGQTYVYRTDREGNQIRAEESLGQLNEQGMVLNWSRSGGIAGFCDQLSVFSAGEAVVSTCKSSDARTSVKLSPEQLSTLNDWAQRLSSFTVEQKDPAVADAMTLTLAFNGMGQQAASDEDKAAMLEFASQVFTAASEQ